MFAEGLILQTNVLHGTGLAFMQMELLGEGPDLRRRHDPRGRHRHRVPQGVQGRTGRGTTRCDITNQRGEIVAVFTPVRLIRGHDYVETAGLI